jgi:hypothetical protein
MEHIPIKRTPTGIHIDGVPDAINLVQIDDAKARQAADLMLHTKDLDFSLSCLEELRSVSDGQATIRQALWRSAVVHFVKCFTGSSARVRLSYERIYKDEKLREAYTYIKNLRDKHLVHDESSYGQCIAGAAINNGKKPFNVEKIVCVSLLVETLDDNSANMLHELVSLARLWVGREYDDLCNSITADLEKEPYEALVNRTPASITPPTADDLKRRRAVLGRQPRRR